VVFGTAFRGRVGASKASIAALAATIPNVAVTATLEP
jgi:hypothetical protein